MDGLYLKQISPSNNQEAKPNPRALAHLDGYKRPLVGSVSANLQRFGLNNVANLESLQEIIAEMSDDDGTGDNPSSDCPLSAAKNKVELSIPAARSNSFDIGEITAMRSTPSVVMVAQAGGATSSDSYAMLIV